ncbi:hypothetical protein AJ79_04636 [Helicocarpus griseus UAMH5409]|uniref:Cell wall mannoprotein 1 n=1 Tax=Helicocarpus griseus UAMH5409 TaxID=1447875 RepID=A0A2B7XSA1_9EURO|nr:hypothetical protein AJ79_04636 [Helicocarpus griseus UAMH5409]
MKVTAALVTLGLALGAVSEPIPAKRDLAAFEGIFSEISSGVDTLSSAINGGEEATIVSAGEALVASINKGVETANGQEELPLNDALSLTAPVQALTGKVEEVIDLVISKKQDFVSAGFAGKVKENLNQQFEASNKLAEAVSSKVPEAVKDIAKDLAEGISNAIQKGIDAYKDVADGGNGGEKPTPTKTSEPTDKPTSEPTGEPEEPEPSETPSESPTPTPTPSGEPEDPSASDPPVEFPGAAAVNGRNIVGVIAAAAAVLAF